MVTLPKLLIIFDYSGTLSLNTALYAAPGNLQKRLLQTGLADLGINTPKIFWEEIVNPTWRHGSTTSVGYKQVMQNRIKELTSHTSPLNSPAKIFAAASRFVDDYLGHSQIDQCWRLILQKLQDSRLAQIVIATDHYAETTDYIINSLKKWEIKAFRVKGASVYPANAFFIIANSADLGVHKSDRHFWEIIKKELKNDQLRLILMIDDFGCNEQKEDAYSTMPKVAARKKKTVRMIQETFQIEVVNLPFIMKDISREFANSPISLKRKTYRELINRTSLLIEDHLNSMVAQ